MNKTICIGDTVKLIGTPRGLEDMLGSIGEVLSVSLYDFVPGGGVALVQFGTVEFKLNFEYLERVVKETLPEGAKRVTRDEFNEIVKDVTYSAFETVGVGNDAVYISLLSVATTARLAQELFAEADSVILSQNQLYSMIWSACDTIIIGREFGLKIPVGDPVSLAIDSVIAILPIVERLFGTSDHA